MIELPSSRDQEKIISYIQDWESANVAPILHLDVGGEDYSDSIPQGSEKQDGIAIVMDATFVGALPLELYGAPVELSVGIGGIEVPRLKGLLSLQEENDDRASTKFAAASAGALADKYDLNERVSYYDDPPYFVVQDALRRLPYPDRGSIRVDVVESPTINFAPGSQPGPFQRNQKVNDILVSVAAVVPYLYRDNSSGGTRAFVSSGLATIPTVPDHMHFHVEDLIFWKSPALALDQYAAVVADKVDQAGDSLFGDNPPTANVVYRGRKHQSPAGLIMRVEWNGTQADAWQFVYRKAGELARGLYKNTPTLPYNPLLETLDPFLVTEHKEERLGEGFYEREWLHYTDSWENSWGRGETEGFATKPTCSVTLANEQFVKAPTLILGLISQGNKKPLWGWEVGVPYWDDSLPWIGLDDTGAWIDEELAHGLAYHDDSGFWIDV